MTGHLKLLGALMASGLLALSALPAKALTAQECSAKYQAAKSAGALNGQKWNDFRKAQCGAGATAAAPAPTPAPASKMAPATKKVEKPRTAASLECSKEADAKGLHGKERKKFRSECKAKAAKPN
jgi:hypothetical protein